MQAFWGRDIGNPLSMSYFPDENSAHSMGSFPLSLSFLLFSIVIPGFKLLS
jgi:hypothetical protein